MRGDRDRDAPGLDAARREPPREIVPAQRSGRTRQSRSVPLSAARSSSRAEPGREVVGGERHAQHPARGQALEQFAAQGDQRRAASSNERRPPGRRLCSRPGCVRSGRPDALPATARSCASACSRMKHRRELQRRTLEFALPRVMPSGGTSSDRRSRPVRRAKARRGRGRVCSRNTGSDSYRSRAHARVLRAAAREQKKTTEAGCGIGGVREDALRLDRPRAARRPPRRSRQQSTRRCSKRATAAQAA